MDTTSKPQEKVTFYQMVKVTFIGMFFLTGSLSIVTSQFLIILFTFYNKEWQRLLLNYTKTNFIVMLTFVIQNTSPTRLIITHDGTVPVNTFQYQSTMGRKLLKAYLEENSIVMANHQIYIDWVYIWFLAYCNKMGNNIYIIMKQSLSNLPILGYGMKNYNFIFLSRKWEQDRSIMTNQLSKIDHFFKKYDDKNVRSALQKHWLILFPEGTNMSQDRLEKSNNWCDKVGTPRLTNMLLPRVKGLYFATSQLSDTTNSIYNLTIGYGGVKQDEFLQDVYTMKRIFLLGKGPKEVHIYFSKTELCEIDNFKYGESLTEAEDEINMKHFEKWLYRTWYQKDEMMNKFYANGQFDTEFPKYETDLKVNNLLEVVGIYAIPITFLTSLFYLYKYLI